MSSKIRFLLYFLLSSAPVNAQPNSELVAKLNTSLTAQDYYTLAEVMANPKTQAEAKATLDWAKERWLAGTTAAVPFA